MIRCKIYHLANGVCMEMMRIDLCITSWQEGNIFGMVEKSTFHLLSPNTVI